MKIKIGLAAFFAAMAAYLVYQLGGQEAIGRLGLTFGSDCKVKQPLSAAPVLAEMVAISEANAKGWKADSVVVDILQSKLRPDGSAEYTRLTSYSASGKATMNISFSGGNLRCETNRSEPDPHAATAPNDFLRDGAALYKIAQAHGQALIDKGYTIETRYWIPDTKWIVELHKEGGTPQALNIDVDARTGAFRTVRAD